jgi:amino acid transporter
MNVKRKMRRAAQRLALGGAASLIGLAGLGFLTAAAWLYLEAVGGAILACAILGFGYLGIGLILMMIASGDDDAGERSAQPEPSRKGDGMPPLATAFLHGMEQGMAARRQ